MVGNPPPWILLVFLSVSINFNLGYYDENLGQGFTLLVRRSKGIIWLPLQSLRGGGKKKLNKKYRVTHLNWITKLSNKSIVFKNRTLTFEGDGWELIDPVEKDKKDLITPAQSLRMKRMEAAKKMLKDEVDVMGNIMDDSASGDQMIIDYNDMLQAAKEVEGEIEEDNLDDLKDEDWKFPKQNEKMPKAVFKSREGATAPDTALSDHTVFPDGNSTIHEVFCRLKPQKLFVKAGRYAWDRVRPSNRELNQDIESRRVKALLDWDYEPIDEEMKDKFLFVPPIATYVEFDKVKKTEIADPLSGRGVEINPGVKEIDMSRFLYVNNRLLLKGASNVNASKFPVRPCNPNSKMCGQWILGLRSRGSFEDMLVTYYHGFRDGADQCIRILGGPWKFSVCAIRCGGGRCVVCEVSSRVTLNRCGIGGFGSKVAADYKCLLTARYKTAQIPKIHCAEGVVLIQNSSANMNNCCIEQTGMLRGCGVRALDHANLRINGSTFRSIRHCALSIGGQARVEANFSMFDLNKAAAFAAYPKSPYCFENMREELENQKKLQPEDEEENEEESFDEDVESVMWGVDKEPDTRAIGTTMILKGNVVYGEPWANETRPERLREGLNRYLPSKMEMRAYE